MIAKELRQIADALNAENGSSKLAVAQQHYLHASINRGAAIDPFVSQTNSLGGQIDSTPNRSLTILKDL